MSHNNFKDSNKDEKLNSPVESNISKNYESNFII